MKRVIFLVLMLALNSCGGGGGGETPPTPAPPATPPPPQTCTHTFDWTNPTETAPDAFGNSRALAPTELTNVTLYQSRVSMATPEEVVAIYDAGDPYTTMWTLRNVQPGTYYYTGTVSNAAGESAHSNEIQKAC